MIVVVGANGFLGRHLCESLARHGEAAVAVSRQPDLGFIEQFAPSLQSMSATDFASTAGEDILRRAKAVVYLTWKSVPSTFTAKPWEELPENVLPAFKFFSRVAELSSVAKVILLSSGGTVYGSEGTSRKTESMPLRPISAYGLGKLMAEETLRFVARTKGLRFAILRVSNALGRWQTSQAQGVVGVALRAAMEGIPVKLYGGGVQVRDFIDADDVAEAIYRASIDEGHPDETWNVGSGVGLRVLDVIELASRVIGRPILTENAPSRAVDVQHVVLDCQKIEDALNWRAQTPIEQSILGIWQAIPSRP